MRRKRRSRLECWIACNSSSPDSDGGENAAAQVPQGLRKGRQNASGRDGSVRLFLRICFGVVGFFQGAIEAFSW